MPDLFRIQNFSKNLAMLTRHFIGQIASFTICCIGFGTAILFAMKGIEIGAITAAIGGVAPIIIAALANFQKRKNKDITEK